MRTVKRKILILDIFTVFITTIIFGTPLYFLLVNTFKDKKEARMLSIAWPDTLQVVQNYKEAFSAQNYMIIRSFWNSTWITFFSVVGLIIVCSMAGYVIQRRNDKLSSTVNAFILAGLMVPPSILPTIWVLQGIGVYKSVLGLVLVEIALSIPFTTMLYRSYMGSIPKELEEAALIDGCKVFGLFTRIIFPVLKPVTSTVVILSAVNIFNDFTNPLYFLPGNKNATIQMTLYNFMGKFSNEYNVLFANIVIITVPMLVLFIIFNKKIVDGMVAGSVKG